VPILSVFAFLFMVQLCTESIVTALEIYATCYFLYATVRVSLISHLRLPLQLLRDLLTVCLLHSC